MSRTPVHIPRILSIAGTDPTGGAGIQADLKSIAAQGGYGMAVVTALVAQNTQEVRTVHRPPTDFLTAQLHSVSDDVTIDAVKIGMLFDPEVIGTVADWLGQVRPPVVVLDPVMVAANGDRLLLEPAKEALRELLGTVDLVTPNLPELAELLGRAEATTWSEALQQGRDLAAAHDVRVLVKGGHLTTTPDAVVPDAVVPDALVTPDGTVAEFTSPRVDTNNTHGTGCSLSAAVATVMAQPSTAGDWQVAVRAAKTWLTESLAAADELQVGQGSGPVSHFAGLWRRGGWQTQSPQEIEEQWWSGISPIRTAIDELPFVQGLAAGTLRTEDFTWYLAQDALYLREYSRVLAAASQLAPTAAEQAFWAQSAHSAIATELELHGSWLPDDLFQTTASPVTTAYLNHLLATVARRHYGEVIAAALPCFWIYLDVGSGLIDHATEQHPYAQWLQTYADPDFAASTRQAITWVSQQAANASAEQRQRMWAAFEASADHEREFFAAPCRREGQPRE